jgi:hypothetical protein
MVQRALRLFRQWDRPMFPHATLDERGLDVRRREFDPEKLADNMAQHRRCLCKPSLQRTLYGPTIRERRQIDAELHGA